jgi:glycerophosphoryl diester phosphodiesterase
MIPALKAAVAAEVEMIEIDVHETHDGHLIVYHDNSLNADTPSWSNLTYAQIQDLAVHKGHVPLLSECLKVINSIPVDIDIKNYVNLANLVRKLNTASLQQGSVISSRDYRLLKQLHMREVQSPLILIVAISPRLSLRQNIRNTLLCIAPQLLPQFLKGIAVYHHLVRQKIVNRLQRKGKKVFVWTVDDRREMEKFISWGVEGIITNYPDRLQKLKIQVQEPEPK